MKLRSEGFNAERRDEAIEPKDVEDTREDIGRVV